MCCGNESFEEISEMFKFTLQQIPCFIFIDGIDQLHGDNPNQVEKVKCLLLIFIVLISMSLFTILNTKKILKKVKISSK